MKLHVLIVNCICLVQIYFATGTELNSEKKNEIINKIRDEFNGGEKFTEDVLTIVEKYQDVDFVQLSTLEGFLGMLSKILRDANTSKIDVNSLNKYKSENKYLFQNGEKVATFFQSVKVLQMVLSKRLPSERYMGIINLFYVVIYPNATTKEIESSLDYLYGMGNVDLKDPLINFSEPNAHDCPQSNQRYSDTKDRLKSMTDIRPVVLHDVNTIIEKFPCDNRYIQNFLEDFVEIIRQLRAFRINESTISACSIKEHPNTLKEWEYDIMRGGTSYGHKISRESIDRNVRDVEWILSTQLTNETFHSVINFEKAIVLKTSASDIQKALEYVFNDLPEANCIVKQGNEAD